MSGGCLSGCCFASFLSKQCSQMQLFVAESKGVQSNLFNLKLPFKLKYQFTTHQIVRHCLLVLERHVCTHFEDCRSWSINQGENRVGNTLKQREEDHQMEQV